nr:RDD family protein [Acinetobacter sp. Marseille-Q1620]
MQIYLARNNQQAGPYSLEQVNQMLADQQILLTDLAWHQGMTEWKALGELTQGKLVYQPQGVNPSETLQTEHSLTSQPSSIQNIEVKRSPRAQIKAATVGKRISAKLIDLALFILPQIIMTMIFMPAEAFQQTTNFSVDDQIKLAEMLKDNMPNWVPIALLAYTFGLLFIQNYLISKSGQSIGKKIFKLQIVDAETNQLPGQLRGFFIRSFLFIVLSQVVSIFPVLVVIFIADIVLFFSKGNNALHDRLAKTKVIDISTE